MNLVAKCDNNIPFAKVGCWDVFGQNILPQWPNILLCGMVAEEITCIVKAFLQIPLQHPSLWDVLGLATSQYPALSDRFVS